MINFKKNKYALFCVFIFSTYLRYYTVIIKTIFLHILAKICLNYFIYFPLSYITSYDYLLRFSMSVPKISIYSFVTHFYVYSSLTAPKVLWFGFLELDLQIFSLRNSRLSIVCFKWYIPVIVFTLLIVLLKLIIFPQT